MDVLFLLCAVRCTTTAVLRTAVVVLRTTTCCSTPWLGGSVHGFVHGFVGCFFFWDFFSLLLYRPRAGIVRRTTSKLYSTAVAQYVFLWFLLCLCLHSSVHPSDLCLTSIAPPTRSPSSRPVTFARFWYAHLRWSPAAAQVIAPSIRAGKRVCICGHENNLRSLLKHVDGVSAEVRDVCRRCGGFHRQG